MFGHVKELQYEARPDRPDPLYAKKLQEVLGGQWGEMSVMMTYLFQGWNFRGPDKYRDTLAFLIARDAMHQNQFLAAIEELEADGLESTPVPSAFPSSKQKEEFAYRYLDFSAGEESRQGRWADGPSPDGRGTLTFEATPSAHGEAPKLDAGDPDLWGTPKRR